GMIAAVVLLARQLEPPILSLAIGVLVGGIGQLLVQLPGLSACGLLVAPSGELRHAAIARVTRLLLPAVFGLAAVQVMVFVNTLLASLLPSGSISYLYYADRVMEFPLGVFGIALASASLPVMARQAAARETRAVADTLNFSLRLAAYIALPAMAGLVVLRAPIVRVLFEPGLFGADVYVLVMPMPARRGLGLLGGRALVASVARTLAASHPLLVWCGLVVLVWPGSRSLLVDVLWLGGTIAGAVGLFWSASVVFD